MIDPRQLNDIGFKNYRGKVWRKGHYTVSIGKLPKGVTGYPNSLMYKGKVISYRISSIEDIKEEILKHTV